MYWRSVAKVYMYMCICCIGAEMGPTVHVPLYPDIYNVQYLRVYLTKQKISVRVYLLAPPHLHVHYSPDFKYKIHYMYIVHVYLQLYMYSTCHLQQ